MNMAANSMLVFVLIFFACPNVHISAQEIFIPEIRNGRAVIEEALRVAIKRKVPAILPAGRYWVDKKITFVLEGKRNLQIRGVPGQTIFQLTAGAVKDRWGGLLQIEDKHGSDISIDGITVSTNAAGNPQPGGAKPYDWEQAAGVALLGSWSSISLTNCATFDCVADGFWVGGPKVGSVQVANFRGWDRSRTRSCFTFTFDDWERVCLSNIDVVAIDFEPNDPVANPDKWICVDGLTCDSFDFGNGAGILVVNRLVVKKSMNLDGYVSTVQGFDATLSSWFRPTRGSAKLQNGIFRVADDFPGDSKYVNALIYTSGAQYNQLPTRVLFENVSVKKGRNKNPSYAFSQVEPVKEFVEFRHVVSELPLLDASQPGDNRITN